MSDPIDIDAVRQWAMEAARLAVTPKDGDLPAPRWNRGTTCVAPFCLSADECASHGCSLRPPIGEPGPVLWQECTDCGGRGYTDEGHWSRPCPHCHRVGFILQTKDGDQ